MTEGTDMSERRATLLSQLNELETIITNALGALTESVEIRDNKIPKPQKVDVERLAAKPYTTGMPEKFTPVKKSKLMPNNMLYKAPALDEGEDPPVEPVEEPQDAQEKEVASALEDALRQLEKLKYTHSIDAADAMQPTKR